MKVCNIYLGLFVFTAIAVVSQLYLFIPITDVLVTTYQKNTSEISLLTSYFGFSYAIGFLIWGPLSDRFGRKRILLLGLLCLSFVSYCLAIFNFNYEDVLKLRIIQGFSAAAFPPIALAFISESFPAEERLKGITWMSIAFLLSALIGQWIGSYFISPSIKEVMMLFTGCYVFALLAHCFLPNQISKKQTSEDLKKEPFTRIIISTLTNISLLRLYVIALSLLSAFVSLYALLSMKANTLLPIGLSVAELRLYAVPCMFTPLLIGKLVQKIGLNKMVVASVLIAAISLFLQSVVSNAGIFIILHLIFVAAIASTVPSVISLVISKASTNGKGFAVSLYTFTLFVGASLGSLLPAYFGENTIYIEVALLGVAVILNLPPKKKKETDYAGKN